MWTWEKQRSGIGTGEKEGKHRGELLILKVLSSEMDPAESRLIP